MCGETRSDSYEDPCVRELLCIVRQGARRIHLIRVLFHQLLLTRCVHVVSISYGHAPNIRWNTAKIGSGGAPSMMKMFNGCTNFDAEGLWKWNTANMAHSIGMSDMFLGTTSAITSCTKRLIVDAWTGGSASFKQSSYLTNWASSTCAVTLVRRDGGF